MVITITNKTITRGIKVRIWKRMIGAQISKIGIIVEDKRGPSVEFETESRPRSGASE